MTEPAEIRAARWVRETRARLGWTIEDLVTVAGVSAAVVHAVESGVGTTRLANVAAVVESLGGHLGVIDAGRDARDVVEVGELVAGPRLPPRVSQDEPDP